MSDNITPLDLNYYENALGKINEFINKNEELFVELHDEYNNNRNAGFSLGASKTSTETMRTLSSIRATALTGAKMLFDAQRSLGDLEIKKRQNVIDESKVENDKAFIRQALSEIVSTEKPSITVKAHHGEGKEALKTVIAKKINSGEITFSKNDKAMKYDDKVMPVLDSASGEIKAVFKDTQEELIDYPIERFQIQKIISTSDDGKIATTDKGKQIPVIEVTGVSDITIA